MYSEGDSDSSVNSEVSESTQESTIETDDSTTELYEEDDVYETDEASEELVEETDTNDESELVENEPEESETSEEEDLQETETTEESDTAESEVDAEAVKAEINEKSDYSDEVNENISSVDELEVYQKAGLKEENIDGKTCLVRDDIDWDQKDEFGRTNRQRVEEDNLVPYNKNGEKVELHHIGQKDDSPLAELTRDEHRGKVNDTILHDKQKETEIDRTSFDKMRSNHWKARVK